MIKSIQEIAEITEKFYQFGRESIPNFSSDQFHRFAANSAASVANTFNVVTQELDIRIDQNAQTAWVDLVQGTLYIPAYYFEGGYFESLGASEEHYAGLAVAIINGSSHHEFLHTVWTYKAENVGVAIRDLVGKERANEIFKKFGEKFFCGTVWNIVEDIFIEGRARREGKTFWIDLKNDVFFPQSILDEINLDSLTFEDAVTGFMMLKNHNATLTHKMKKFLKQIPQFGLLHNELIKFQPSAKQRVKIAEHFAEVLREMFPEAFNEAMEIPNANGTQKFEGEFEIDLDALTENFASTVIKVDMNYVGVTSKYEEPVEMDINQAVHVSYSTIPTHMNESFDASWVRELRAKRTLRKAAGVPANEGSDISEENLWRIGVDSRVFETNQVEAFKGERLEVILLVDFSSSTRGTILENNLGATKTTSKMLKGANIAHSVFGFTSIRGSSQRPFLFHIYSYDMNVTNIDFEARFQKASHMYLGQNHDGVVLEMLQDKFTARRAARYIVVVSDGAPSAPMYSGQTARNDTKQKIAKLRKMGVAVFALSTVEDVVDKNDEIYGKTFNIRAFGNVTAQMKKLMYRLG